MGRLKVSQEYKKQVALMYVGGMTAQQVSDKTGHARRTVTKWVEEFGYPVFRSTDRIPDRDGMRTCIQCSEEKYLEKDFYLNSGSKQRLWICKECTKLNRKRHYEENKEEAKAASRLRRKNDPLRHREYDMKRRFKIGYPEFEERFNQQGRVCAGCGSPESGMKSGEWAIDHDHECCPYTPHGAKTCGQCIRGILCRTCNTTLGNAKDSISRLRRLADYLEKYQQDKSSS